jgi:hypothetical protein
VAVPYSPLLSLADEQQGDRERAGEGSAIVEGDLCLAACRQHRGRRAEHHDGGVVERPLDSAHSLKPLFDHLPSLLLGGEQDSVLDNRVSAVEDKLEKGVEVTVVASLGHRLVGS